MFKLNDPVCIILGAAGDTYNPYFQGINIDSPPLALVTGVHFNIYSFHLNSHFVALGPLRKQPSLFQKYSQISHLELKIWSKKVPRKQIAPLGFLFVCFKLVTMGIKGIMPEKGWVCHCSCFIWDKRSQSEEMMHCNDTSPTVLEQEVLLFFVSLKNQKISLFSIKIPRHSHPCTTP